MSTFATPVEMPPRQRILVVRLGAMGDIIHTLPAVCGMRNKWPQAHITWLVDSKWSYLLGKVRVDRILELNRRDPASIWQVLKTLHAERAHWAIDFQGLIKSAVPARIGAPKVVGFHQDFLREKPAALFYTQKVRPHSRHIISRNMDLSEACGGHLSAEFPLPDGHPEGELPEKPYVLASPLAGWASKEWPLERYAELAPMLSEVGVRLVVNGPPSAAAQLEACRPAHIHLSGLPGLIHATRGASAVVGLDSGPLHLAACFPKGGVALFGPTDPERNGPWAGSIGVVRRPDARTTYKRRGTVDESMRQITAREVFDALMKYL